MPTLLLFVKKPARVWITLLSYTLLFILCGIPADAQPQKPNIILILADDIGYEIPTCNGGQSYSTPNIDRLAQEGMRFTQCRATPLCSPSRFMMLTGKYNFRNYTRWGAMNLNQRTIANMLKDAGYKTACYGKWQFGGGDQSIHTFGFDNYSVYNPLGAAKNTSRYKNPQIYEAGDYLSKILTADKYGDDIFTDSVMNFIENNRSEPFFIYYPMCLSHNPLSPTPDDTDFAAWDTKNPGDTAYFPSMIKYMDKKVGMVIDKVKSLGIENNTVVIFTGDNGTPGSIYSEFVDSTIKGGKHKTTEQGTHVPLLVYWNGKISPGTVNDDLIDFTDFLPTLAGIANISLPTTYGILDGVSFAPRLTGQPGTPRDWIFCHFNPELNKDTSLTRWAQTKTYKLYDTSSETSKYKFYNFPQDLPEKKNIPNALLTPEEKIIRQRLLDVLNYITKPGVPALSDPTVSDISYFSAVIGTDINSDSASTITARGIVWSTHQNPSLADNFTSDGAGIGSFTSSITGLIGNTTYYIRSYAINQKGTGYSNQVSFTTPSIPAPVAKEATILDSNSFTANWLASSEATSYRLDVSISSTFSSYSPATLKEGFDDGTEDIPDGWAINPKIGTYTNKGKFGSASPSLQFTGSKQTVVTSMLNGSATQLSFWIKGIGNDPISSFLVEGFDGNTWTTIKNMANLPTTGTTIVFNDFSTPVLGNDFIQFRFTYTKSAGKLAFDDVSVKYNRIKPSFISGYDNRIVNNTSRKITGLAAGTNYYYRVRAAGSSISVNSNVILATTCSTPALSTDITNLNCKGSNNGAIALNITGGTPPITYSWTGPAGFTSSDQNINDLRPGTYNVTIRSNGACATQASSIVMEPAALTASTTVGGLCYGNTANLVVTAAGGTGNYHYTLLNENDTTGPQDNNTFIVAAGSYTIIVEDDNHCSVTISPVTVTKPDLLVAGESHTPINCAGGESTVTISATGGTIPYTGTGGFTQGAGSTAYTVTDANGCSATTEVIVTEPDLLIAGESHTPVNCAGGESTVTISATGGTVPYTGTGDFTQNTGLTTYTITDANGCTATIDVTIFEPETLIANESHTPISCSGGESTVTISATGGIGPYTGTGDFTQKAGLTTYTVTDANGCTATIDVTIFEPETLIANESHTPISCSGGESTVTISATGGIGPYTGTGDFTQKAGLTTYTVTDANGCTTTIDVTITEPETLIVNENHTPVSCSGGESTVTINATGGTGPYTGTGDFMQGTGATTYTVTDANGCVSTTEVIVTEPDLLIAGESHTPVNCIGGESTVTISATGGTGPYTGTGDFMQGAGAATYTITDANGCIADAMVLIEEGTENCFTDDMRSLENVNHISSKHRRLDKEEMKYQIETKVLPNPSQTEFTLSVKAIGKETISIRVLNMYGKIVYETRGSADQKYTFGRQFVSGVYIVQVLQGKNLQTLKIVKG